jgi:hypothetical protein
MHEAGVIKLNSWTWSAAYINYYSLRSDDDEAMGGNVLLEQLGVGVDGEVSREGTGGRRHPQPQANSVAPSPVRLSPLVLAAAALLAPRPNSAVDPVGTYCAKNFTASQKQASISAVLVPRASAAYYATATTGSGSAI